VARPGITAQKKRRIRELRAKGLTMAQVAERTGVSLSTVLRYGSAEEATTSSAAMPNGSKTSKEAKRASADSGPAKASRHAAPTFALVEESTDASDGARMTEVEDTLRTVQAQLAGIGQQVSDVSQLMAQLRLASDADAQRAQWIEDSIRVMGADLSRLKAKKPRWFR
jgi:hypothetical protein